MRRLRARFSGVSFATFGWNSPYPAADRLRDRDRWRRPDIRRPRWPAPWTAPNWMNTGPCGLERCRCGLRSGLRSGSPSPRPRRERSARALLRMAPGCQRQTMRPRATTARVRVGRADLDALLLQRVRELERQLQSQRVALRLVGDDGHRRHGRIARRPLGEPASAARRRLRAGTTRWAPSCRRPRSMRRTAS